MENDDVEVVVAGQAEGEVMGEMKIYWGRLILAVVVTTTLNLTISLTIGTVVAMMVAIPTGLLAGVLSQTLWLPKETRVPQSTQKGSK